LTFPQTRHRASHLPTVKDFNVAANIIAQVAPNQIGKLVVELSGDIDQLDAAIEWILITKYQRLPSLSGDCRLTRTTV